MKTIPKKLSLEEWMPVIQKLLALLVAVAMSYGAGSHEESVAGELQATEFQATEKARLSTSLSNEYASFEELARHHWELRATCDTALEAFSRHRDDDRDWEHVVRVCHSEEAVPGDRPLAEAVPR